MKIGIRVDVDTFKGMRKGVPCILDILSRNNIQATFFFSMGPDNMGRNIWRLLRPAFLWKMLRTNAPDLYGWDILLAGTLWPGKLIGKNNAEIIKRCARGGHEIGVHCWNHYQCQNFGANLSEETFRTLFSKAFSTLADIIGKLPVCSGVPAWRCTDNMLKVKESFHFRYNSDCHGTNIFKPIVNGEALSTPQIPLTLPTFDELIGRKGVTIQNYNETLLSLLQPNALNVLAVHAEVEGGIYAALFDAFVKIALERGFELVPLGKLLPIDLSHIAASPIVRKSVEGREGWGSWQEKIY